MKTKINRVTIVCHEGTKSYYLGQEVNGLKIFSIKDVSAEWDNSIDFMYSGLTSCGATVFETINAPIEVEYCPEEPPTDTES